MSTRMLLWLLAVTLVGAGCLMPIARPAAQPPVILQPESPLVTYDFGTLVQNQWRVTAMTAKGVNITFPALEPIFISIDPFGSFGVNVSNDTGIAYQTIGAGNGHYQLAPAPSTPLDCGEPWNREYAQLKELFSATTAYEIRGTVLTLRGDDVQIDLVIDGSSFSPRRYSDCTQVMAEEANPMIAMYAETYGLAYAEAQRRLELQVEMSLLESKVIAGEPTYAGSWMEHQPEFGLVIGFASPDGEKLMQKYLVGIPWADLVRIKQMPYTIAELSAIAEQVQPAALKTGVPFESGINIPLAKVTFYTPYPEELRRQLEANESIQPYIPDIEYVYQEALSVPLAQQNQAAASYAAPELGIAVDATMKVVDIDRGSAAELAGIQKGDQLLSIDGVSFLHDKERAEALIHEFPGEEVYKQLRETGVWQGITRKLKLEREGNEIEIAVTPAPLLWWGLSPTPTEISPDLELDYL